MNYFTLPDGQTKVSQFSLGAWAFSGADVWGDYDQGLAIKTMHQAIDAGINLIDSAEKYGDGESEKTLGLAIKDRRDKVMISTKVYSDMLWPDQVQKNCEASLKRLQTDYIDIYLIHWPNPEIPLAETLGAFKRLREQGKIRHFAVSNFSEKNLADLLEIGDPPAVLNQLPYSLLWRHAEAFFPNDDCEIAKQRPAAWTYSPLAQGLLTGKFKTLDDVPLNRRTTRMYSSKWGVARHSGNGYEKEIFAFLDDLRAISDESGISMTALALQDLLKL